MLVLLAFAAFCWLRLTAACDLQVAVVRPPKVGDPAFCIREATRSGARYLFVQRDGVCQIYTCLTAKSVNCQPIFTLQRPMPQLLLRTSVITGSSVIAYLKNAAVNASSFPENISFTSNYPFKSPLLSAAFFSHVRVQMHSEKTTVYLRFRLQDLDVIKETEWFALDRLESAMPWDVKKIKTNENVIIFNTGTEGRSIYEFVVSEKDKDCLTLRGAMFISNGKGTCDWDSNSSYQYMFAVTGKEMGTWNSDAQKANEFRLIGDMDEGSFYKLNNRC